MNLLHPGDNWQEFKAINGSYSDSRGSLDVYNRFEATWNDSFQIYITCYKNALSFQYVFLRFHETQLKTIKLCNS